MLEDRALYEAIQIKGRQLVREKYNWDLIARRMKEVFVEMGKEKEQELK